MMLWLLVVLVFPVLVLFLFLLLVRPLMPPRRPVRPRLVVRLLIGFGLNFLKGGIYMDVGRASRLGLYRKTRERSRDRKVFAKTAGHTRRENVSSNPMRGGIRL